MQEIKKIYLCGLGAVGCSYASVLERWRPGCVGIIADQERIERYSRDGVTVNGTVVPFSYIRPDEKRSPADLILIAVKRGQLLEAVTGIRNFVCARTVILSLLNGVDSEEVIGQEYGNEKLLYSFVVGTDASREGSEIRYSKLGTIVFGERINLTHSDRVTAVRELFDLSGIPYRIPENMIRELWWKFMMNVGINQTSAVMRVPYRIYQTTEEARQAMRLACMEVVRLSEKLDIGLTEKDVEEYFAIVNGLMPEGKTSMLQDVEACRKTEVEAFAGTVIDLGRRHGVPTPINNMLYAMIRAMERNYSNGRR
jgi:2-dehydropantoate 2-reductase